MIEALYVLCIFTKDCLSGSEVMVGHILSPQSLTSGDTKALGEGTNLADN